MSLGLMFLHQEIVKKPNLLNRAAELMPQYRADIATWKHSSHPYYYRKKFYKILRDEFGALLLKSCQPAIKGMLDAADHEVLGCKL